MMLKNSKVTKLYAMKSTLFKCSFSPSVYEANDLKTSNLCYEVSSVRGGKMGCVGLIHRQLFCVILNDF